jgi:Ca2+-binding RTX toxin-like protein
MSARCEQLERRRLLAVDLSFGETALSGWSLFSPGKDATVVAIIRNQGTTSATGFSVTFKYIDIGFSSDPQNVSFDDPSAVVLATTTITEAIPPISAERSFNFPLHFPANLNGRYALIGKVDADNTIVESLESNNTKFFGVGRALPSTGNLLVTGTAGADRITITPARHATRYNVAVNGVSESFSADKITAFTVRTEAGNDQATITGAVPRLRFEAGDGDDKIVGGSADDTIIGGLGNDWLFGGLGNDRIEGSGGNDRLFGQGGSDRLLGDAGNDIIDGGTESDRLYGGAGIDTLLGQSGNDRFFAKDRAADQLFGDGGTDSADVDLTDARSSIESTIT